VLSVSAVGEPWESVLVRVEDVVTLDARPGFNEFVVGPVSGDPVQVYVDDALHLWSGYGALADGDPFLSIQGPLNFSFGAFKVAVRDDGDVVEGAIDTADTGLSGPALVPIYDLQQSGVVEGTAVTAQGVVSGVGPYGVYVQDPAGGPYSGIFVYLGFGWEALYGGLTAGDEVEVSGTYVEYFGASEIEVQSSPVARVELLGSAALPVPEVLTLADVGEPWEGVLITVEDVAVVDPAWGAGSFEIGDPVTLDRIVVNDDLHLLGFYGSLTAGLPLQEVTGVVDYQNAHYELLIRSDADVVP
jgi:hypothetical protein